MKLQADSNYLLSKEYEVQLRCNDVLASLVLSKNFLSAFTVESQPNWAQELEWHLGSHRVFFYAWIHSLHNIPPSLISQFDLQNNRQSATQIGWKERINRLQMQTDAVSYLTWPFACLGDNVVGWKVPRLWIQFPALQPVWPGASELSCLSLICKMEMRLPPLGLLWGWQPMPVVE